jgi:asparagine synthase (glutamine-hydrolysing)
MLVCGIAGKISENTNALELANALLNLNHRGPNDSGTFQSSMNNKVLNLGQTRLSIIDLSSGGHQPFISLDQNYILVFNGEIYNFKELRNYLRKYGYKFDSESDTEVLLNAWIHWGPESLSKLKGMFAFAIFDKKNNLLTLARDAFGMKPLFFHQNSENFAFASEIGALKKLIPGCASLNSQTMFNYLAFGQQSFGQDTFFQDIMSLEPGHFLQIKCSSSNIEITCSRWWWPKVAQNFLISDSEAIKEVRERFLENVRLHLISDVPLGATLSGGLDSSAIVCAMRFLEPSREINTFSFVSSGHMKNEETWVDIINKHVGAIPNKVVISPKELLFDLDDMITYQGEPVGSTSIYAQYRVYKQVRDSGITVVLDGQGADELLGGYLGYPVFRVQSLISSGNYIQASNFLLNWAKGPDRSLRDVIQRLIGKSFIPRNLVPITRKMVKKDFSNKIFRLDLIDEFEINKNQILEIDWPKDGNRALVSELRRALTKRGLSELLRYADRNSMRWSIENRLPFLTTDLAEFVLQLPEHLLVSQKGITKNVFREAMKGIVPDSVLNRKDKIGFETPELEWLQFLRHDIDIWLEDLAPIHWINLAEVKNHFNDVLSGRRKFDWQTWRLINSAKWMSLVLFK